MKNTYSVLFYLKKSKGDASTLRPIYCRVTINSNRFELSVGRKCDLFQWNQAACKMNGSSAQAKQLNAHLQTVLANIHEARRSLLDNHQDVNLETLREAISGIKPAKKMLLEIFKQHNEDALTLIDKGFARATVIRYQTAYNHTFNFIQWKYKKSDIAIDDLDYEFVSQFELWLKTKQKCNHNSAMKYITNMKKIVVLCLKHGWLDRDPFYAFKKHFKEVVREFLNEEEIQTMMRKDFVNERLTLVRDIFIFSCHTGLCYADIAKLKRTEVVVGVDGEKWIHTRRQKTETVSRIPLLPTALQLLEKYRKHPRCVNEDLAMPVLSNQKMNGYLQEIAQICGIPKLLTFHCARHTFATTVTLTNGVPIESVSKMLGHRNLKTTQHYAKILDLKVGEDMKALRERMNTSQ